LEALLPSWSIVGYCAVRQIIEPVAKDTLILLSQRYRHAALFDLFQHVPLGPEYPSARRSTPDEHAKQTLPQSDHKC
jgi:hypothetical protein